MNLSSGLPYASDVYWVLMQSYNSRWLAVTVLCYAGGMGLVWAAVCAHPMTRAMTRAKRRILGFFLAGIAAWNGAMHQQGLMADLNFMAPLYALGWGAFALWLVLRWAVQSPPAWGQAPSTRQETVFGTALMLTGLFVYPALQILSGAPLAGVEYAGTAPNASALFIAGAVLAFTGRSRLDLLIFPVIWSAVAGLHAVLLGQAADYLVPVVLVFTVASLAIARARRAGRDRRRAKTGA